MSHLPPGWATALLPEMVTSSGVFSDGDWVESKDQDPTGDVRLIQLADVGDGSYRNRSNRFLTLEKAHELGCTFLREADVLIARMPEPLGRACVFPGDPKASVTVVDVCVVRPGHGAVDARWLMYTLNAPQSRKAMATFEKGTTRKRVSRGNLARIPFPVPPLAEQARIVAAVEEEFSRLDAGVAAVERGRQNLKRMRDATAQFALTGALSLAQGAPPSEGNGLAASWSRTNWGGVLAPGKDSFRRGPFGSAITKAMFVESGFVVYEQYAAINDDCDHARYFLSRDDYERLAGFAVEAGDFLISCSGTIGRITRIPDEFHRGVINQALLRVRLDQQKIMPDYFLRLFRSPYFQRQMLANSTGTAMANVKGVSELKAILIPLPPIEEQPAILTWLSSIHLAIDRAALALDKMVRRSESLRSSILAAAFSGFLVPQNPADEPAAVLLQRIAAERASANGHKPTSSRKRRVKPTKVPA